MEFLAGVIGVILGFLLTFSAEECKSWHKRQRILRALCQVTKILLDAVHQRNLTATEQTGTESSVPMFYPTSPFENAFLSENAISVGSECTAAVAKYLDKANELNALARVLRDTLYMEINGKMDVQRDETKRKLGDQVKLVSDFSMYKIREDLERQINYELSLGFWVVFSRDFVGE